MEPVPSSLIVPSPPVLTPPPVFVVPLLAVAGVAVLAAALFHRWRQVRAAHPEISLGGGTAVVIEGVTWGTNQTLLREPAQWTRLKEALPPAWRWITGPPQSPHKLRGIQSPHLWLSRRDLTAGRYVTVGSVEVSALTKDGAEFQSNGYHGFGSAERAERAAE